MDDKGNNRPCFYGGRMRPPGSADNHAFTGSSMDRGPASSSLSFQRTDPTASSSSSSSSGFIMPDESLLLRSKDWELARRSEDIMTSNEYAQRLSKFALLQGQLQQLVKGKVLLRGDEDFSRRTTLFNSAAPVYAWLVAMPLHTADVVSIVKFCNSHNLSPSAKSGGFSTAGWATQGDVVIDMRLMDDVRMYVPHRSSTSRPPEPSSSGSTIAESSSALASTPGVTTISAPSVAVIDERAQLERQLRETAGEEKVEDMLKDTAPSSLQNVTIQVGGNEAGVTLQPLPSTNDGSGKADALLSPTLAPTRRESRTRKADEAFGVDADERKLSLGRSSTASTSSTGKPSINRTLSESSGEAKVAVVPGSTKRRLLPLPDEEVVGSSSSTPGVGATSQKGGPLSVPTGVARASSDNSDGTAKSSSALALGTPPLSAANLAVNAAQSAAFDPMALYDTITDQVMSSLAQQDVDAGKGKGKSKEMDSDLLPRTRSGESGTDADIELEAEDGESRSPMRSATSPDLGDSEMGFVKNKPASPLERVKAEASGEGALSGGACDNSSIPSSGPTTGTSVSGTDSMGSVLQSRSDSNTSHDPSPGGDGKHDGNAPPVDWDPTSTFEHQRWQKHHQPEGPSVPRVALPSGGFVWREGETTSAFLGQAPPLAGSGRPSLFEAPQANSSRPSFLQLSSDARASFSSDTSNTLPPGIHSDKHAIVSFGPGAGVRGVDTFTDRAGRLSEFETRRNSAPGSADDGSSTTGAKATEEDMHVIAKGVPYHVPFSAYPVGSTATTTGGFGYLVRAYGLTVDNLLEVELVTADGRVLILNEQSMQKSEEERDLWWAVRGAAPCFGIITRMSTKAYPVPSVYSGNLIWPLNLDTAPSLIRHWRDCLKAGVPRELYASLILTAGPTHSSHVIVMQFSYLGTKAEGEPYLQAISSWNGERLLLKDVEERSFLSQQDGVAQVLKGSADRRWIVRGDLIENMTDEFIYESVQRFQNIGSRTVWLFELGGGASDDSNEDASCISKLQRSARFTLGALQQWAEQEEDIRCASSVDEWMQSVVSKVSVGGPYPCFLERREPLDRVRRTFGDATFEKLLRIKRKWDPMGMFRHTFASGLCDAANLS